MRRTNRVTIVMDDRTKQRLRDTIDKIKEKTGVPLSISSLSYTLIQQGLDRLKDGERIQACFNLKGK